MHLRVYNNDNIHNSLSCLIHTDLQSSPRHIALSEKSLSPQRPVHARWRTCDHQGCSDTQWRHPLEKPHIADGKGGHWWNLFHNCERWGLFLQGPSTWSSKSPSEKSKQFENFFQLWKFSDIYRLWNAPILLISTQMTQCYLLNGWRHPV